jgi:hypothetical protein
MTQVDKVEHETAMLYLVYLDVREHLIVRISILKYYTMAKAVADASKNTSAACAAASAAPVSAAPPA